MSREWAPGDVAFLTYDHADRGKGEHIAMYAAPNCRMCFSGMSSNQGHWHGLSGMLFDADTYKPRPLVVIDAEDREQVERLRRGVMGPLATASPLSDWQDALRSLLAPPKPPEPLGLGAVVVDDRGVRWVRSESAKGMRNPWLATLHPAELDTARLLPYAEVAVVKVLSEGVTTDE